MQPLSEDAKLYIHIIGITNHSVGRSDGSIAAGAIASALPLQQKPATRARIIALPKAEITCLKLNVNLQ